MRLYLKVFVTAMALLFTFCACGQTRQEERLSFDRPDDIIKSNVFLNGVNVGGKHKPELAAMLKERAAANFTAPVDATVNRRTWEIIPEIPGRRLNAGRTLEALAGAREGDRVEYAFDVIAPAVTADMLKQKIRVIGEYTTVLLDRSDSRVNNIQIASDKINHTILKPGEEFSFNKVVGKRTSAKGYEEAPIIVRTPEGPKKKKAKGGGVCQISTTIYSAVEMSGLKVTERHLHSLDVGYVPRGDDATVSYGTVDFRFVNTRSSPIMLRLDVNTKSITVRIFENKTA